jgi:hypothetical protein
MRLFLVKMAFISLVIFAFSCKKDLGPTDLRVKNTTDFTFTDVEINTSEGIHNYGTVNGGEITDYKRFDMAYRQAIIELFIHQEKYTLTPGDYTYEVPLGRGRFTYELSADTTAKTLSIHVTADEPLD